MCWGGCLSDECASLCSSSSSRLLHVFVHHKFWPREHLGEEADADQQEVKLSTQQQDSGPGVSAVTCQAKEITTDQRLHSSVDSGQPNTLSTQLKRRWHDITEVCVISGPSGIVVSCRITNLRL